MHLHRNVLSMKCFATCYLTTLLYIGAVTSRGQMKTLKFDSIWQYTVWCIWQSQMQNSGLLIPSSGEEEFPSQRELSAFLDRGSPPHLKWKLSSNFSELPSSFNQEVLSEMWNAIGWPEHRVWQGPLWGWGSSSYGEDNFKSRRQLQRRHMCSQSHLLKRRNEPWTQSPKVLSVASHGMELT